MTPDPTIIRLFNYYESQAQVYHYYGLLAIHALCRTADAANDDLLRTRCVEILRRFPDQIEHSYYNFPSYRIGGIPRAYMLMRGHLDDAANREQVSHYAEEMMTAPRDEMGIMCKPNDQRRDKVWIDVAMAVTPYLLFAGLALDEPRYIDEAVRQSELMYGLFLNQDNGLLRQSRGFVDEQVFSTDAWGRGNGWGLIALTELVDHLPADSQHRPNIQRLFAEHCEAILPYQAEHGLWRQDLTLPWAYPESSGTGLFVYGFAVGIRRGLLDAERFGPACDRAVTGLREYCINEQGGTAWCCPGCLSPGRGTPADYALRKPPVANDPHSYAPIMLALLESGRVSS
jgi:unsaturated rhamnogalacturonyl hydrolase